MLTATRREWNELYVFFALLGKGSVTLGDEEGKPSPRVLPIVRISRQEHDGKREYQVEKDEVHVTGGQMDGRFPREDFRTAAALILEALKQCREDEVEAPEGVEDFLDALKIYDMPFVLTQGGPGNSTEFLSLHIYRLANAQNGLIGRAAANAIVLMVLSTAISKILLHFQRKP